MVRFEFKKHSDLDKWWAECQPRLENAAKLKLPHLREEAEHGGTAVIVGSGPSLVDFVEDIRAIKGSIFSLNSSHAWLLKNGIVPNNHVIFEDDLTKASTALGGKPHEDVTYYVCSHCEPQVFDDLAGFKRVLWHASADLPEYIDAIERLFPNEFMVAGSYATFFRTMTIALVLGFNKFLLYGMDSSFKDATHAEGCGVAATEPTFEAGQFTTKGDLMFQASEFVHFCTDYHHLFSMRVFGDGYLAHLHKTKYPEQYDGD